MANEREHESMPGTSGTSGPLTGESLQVMVQSLVEKALEAERAHSLSVGLTSSGECTVEISPNNYFGMMSLGSVDMTIL